MAKARNEHILSMIFTDQTIKEVSSIEAEYSPPEKLAKSDRPPVLHTSCYNWHRARGTCRKMGRRGRLTCGISRDSAKTINGAGSNAGNVQRHAARSD